MKKSLKRLMCLFLCAVLAVGGAIGAYAIYIHDARFASGYHIENVIDISQYQGTIDWQKVYASGVKNVIIRAGYRGYKYGGLSEDDAFIKNVKDASAAGLNVGAYFYSQAVSVKEAEEEANFVVDLILINDLESKINLPIACDFEYYEDIADDGSNAAHFTGRLYKAGLTKSDATDIINAFCNKIAVNGFKTLIYTNKFMLEYKLVPSSLKADIWLARWADRADYSGNYIMWQYTNKGSVNGISTIVDLSYWYQPTTSNPGTQQGTSQESDKTATDTNGVITVNYPSSTLTAGTSSQFTASVNQEALSKLFTAFSFSSPTWKSSNSGVAEVDSTGKVTALTTGTAVITASVMVTDKSGASDNSIAFSAAVPVVVTVSQTSSSGSSSSGDPSDSSTLDLSALLGALISGAGSGTGTGTGTGTGGATIDTSALIKTLSEFIKNFVEFFVSFFTSLKALM